MISWRRPLSLVLMLSLPLLAGGCGARSELAIPLDAACGLDPVSMDVPSAAPWLDTGIDVIAGQRLVITATGEVRYGTNEKQVTGPDGGHFSGKKFFPAAVLPDTMIVSLIGKVGGSLAVDTGVPLPEGVQGNGPGFVGATYDAIVPASGRLFLGFNDQEQAFGDNTGAFTVTITVVC